MERDFLEWINKTYKMLVDNKYIPKMELGLPDGGKISVYRVVDVIRIDIKRPETKRGQKARYKQCERYVEIASTTKEIFQSHRIAFMQSFVVAMKIVTVMEYRLCMMIVAMILRKRSDFMKWNKISDGLSQIGYPVIVTIFD